MVGSRRRIEGRTTIWLACAAWVAWVYWLHRAHTWEVDEYLLRLVLGAEAYSATMLYSGIARGERTELPVLRRGLAAVVAAGGVVTIYSIARWRERRRSVASFRGVAVASNRD